MKFTRQHFESIADVIRVELQNAPPGEVRTALTYLAGRMANNLALSNAKFDRERFMKACGVENE